MQNRDPKGHFTKAGETNCSYCIRNDWMNYYASNDVKQEAHHRVPERQTVVHVLRSFVSRIAEGTRNLLPETRVSDVQTFTAQRAPAWA